MAVMEPIVDSVNKGGRCWFEMSLTRNARGLELYVKTAPEVEEFAKSLGAGTSALIEMHTREWFPVGGTTFSIYDQSRNAPDGLAPFNRVGEPLRSTRDGKCNISFLRGVGIGSPDGIRFGIVGPYSRSYCRDCVSQIVGDVRNVIREYIVPLNINLRISSQEV